MRNAIWLLGIVTLLGLLGGCGDDDADGDGPRKLRLITHDSFALDEETLRSFEVANNATVEVLKRGDAGRMVTALVLSKDNPEGDLVYGIDNTLHTRALQARVFESYEAEGQERVARDLRVDGNMVTPIDVGFVNLNYDVEALRKAGLTPPQRLEELTDPRWRGKVVVENAASSSPGLAFLIATVKYFGEERYLDWRREMRANGLVVVDGWETAYNQNFSLRGGPQPIVVSYASSPPFEQLFADPPRPDAPSGNILPPNGVFRQVEYAGVLRKGKQKELARKFIDFLLSQAVQEQLPLQMAVYPVIPGTKLPPAFEQFGKVEVAVVSPPPEEIAKSRDRWIEEWTKAVLR